MRSKLQLFFSGVQRSHKKLPKSSEVLKSYLKQRNLTSWTAFYVPRCDAENDLWGCSHFNFEVEGVNYHILRTGAYPFIKFHCTQRPKGQDLSIENHFYNVLKVTNFGFPCFLYGLAGLLWANHTEKVTVKGNISISNINICFMGTNT